MKEHFWPWKTIERLKTELSAEREARQILQGELKDHLSGSASEIKKKDEQIKRMAMIIALKGGVTLAFLMLCISCFSQPVVRTFTSTNYSGFDPTQFSTNNGLITATNIPASIISGVLSNVILFASDFSSNLTSTVFPVGMPVWYEDWHKLYVGNGSTPGGWPISPYIFTNEVLFFTASNQTPLVDAHHGLGHTPTAVRWVLYLRTNSVAPDNYFLLKIGDETDAINLTTDSESPTPVSLIFPFFTGGVNATNVWLSALGWYNAQTPGSLITITRGGGLNLLDMTTVFNRAYLTNYGLRCYITP